MPETILHWCKEIHATWWARKQSLFIDPDCRVVFVGLCCWNNELLLGENLELRHWDIHSTEKWSSFPIRGEFLTGDCPPLQATQHFLDGDWPEGNEGTVVSLRAGRQNPSFLPLHGHRAGWLSPASPTVTILQIHKGCARHSLDIGRAAHTCTRRSSFAPMDPFTAGCYWRSDGSGNRGFASQPASASTAGSS